MLRRASSYMIAHGVPAVFGFAAIIIFTRLLTPEEYGIYVVGMSIAGIVNALLFTWVRLSILRYQSEGIDVRMTALVGLGLSAALSPLAVLGVVLLTGDSLNQILLATLVALALGLFEFNQEILKARQQAGSYMRAAILRAVLTLAFSFTLVQMGLGGASLLLGISAAYILTSLAFAPTIWRGTADKFQRDLFRTMLIFGAPMAVSGIVFALHAALDRLIIVYLLGEGAAGAYGASADLVRQMILFPATAIGSTMVPIVIRALADQGRAEADRQLSYSIELLLAVVLPAVVGLALVAPNFSALMLGEEFREAAALLIPVLAFAWLFQALTHQFIQISFHISKKARLFVIQGFVLLVVNVIATFALVPPFGLVGAAWALVIAEAAGVVAGYVLAARAYPLPFPVGRIVRVVLAAVVMAVPTALIAWWIADPVISLAATIITGIVTYALAAVAFDLVGLRGMVMDRLRKVSAPA